MSILNTAIAVADTEQQAANALFIKSRCEATGMEPASYRCVIGAMVRLGDAVASRGPAWRNDHEFVGALLDLECNLFTKLQQINRLIRQINVAIAQINEYTPLEHIDALYASLDLLHPAASHVTAALNRVIAAPEELAETYAACYRHVRAGKKLPYDGRFISGEIAPPAA
ncbi:hypothetical protein ACQEVF_32340 [Nonomuraea polychroma]|uniref:hypothetical protein n=1 Tax=Nonomuraea polychroma TaxID=46176 RepID=UPI003D8DB7F7